MKYSLCDDCNYLRMHGMTRIQALRIKHISNQEKKRLNPIRKEIVNKKRKAITKISTKQIDINSKYKETCIIMDATTAPICSGCARRQQGEIMLSHSHVISRADCKKLGRPDLIYLIDNLRYHCMDFGTHKGCHTKWESKNINIMNKMYDFKHNMEFIRSISEELYRRIMNKHELINERT